MSDNELQYRNLTRKERRRRIRLHSESSDSDSSVIINVSTRRKSYRVASDSSQSSKSSDNSGSSNDSNSTASGHVSTAHRKRTNPYRLVRSDNDSSSSDTFNPRKKIKHTLLSDSDSSSSSDSDSETIEIQTRRREEFIIDNMNSSSSSSSDSVIPRPSNSTRKPLTRSSNNEEKPDGAAGSSDSSSSSEAPITSRNHRVPRLISSNEGSSSDDSGDDSDDSFKNKQPKKSAKKLVILDSESSSSSSEGDDQAECCPICFRKLKNQEIGTPESCDHTYCVACLKEWAKSVNTCPVDRQRFTLILVRKTPGGKIIDQIPIQTAEPENNVADDDPTYCEICGQCDREERMMLCDGCDLGYHLECLTPPLNEIPVTEWFCPNCSLIYALGDHIEELSTDLDVDDDLRSGRRGRRTMRRTHYLRPGRESPNEESDSRNHWDNAFLDSHLRQVRRLIPRTRQSQRIMNALMNSANLNNEHSNEDVESDGNYEEVDNTNVAIETPTRSTAKKQTKTRRVTKRKRKTRRKRKNCRFKIKLITTEEGVIEVKLPRKKKRRYRRKTKKTRQGTEQGRVRVSQKKTVKERLAKRLGLLCSNRRASNQQITAQSETPVLAQSSAHSSFRQGIPTLDLFGARDQLDYFSGVSDEDDMNIGGSNDIGGQLLTQSSHRSSLSSDLRVMTRKKAAAVLSRSQQQARSAIRKKNSAASATSTAPATSGSLLDSILDSQTKWHSKNSEIIHNHTDGSLTVKVKEEKVDINKENVKATETPLYPGSNNPHGSRFSNYDYQPRDRNISAANTTANLNSASSSSSSTFPSSNLSSFPSTRASFSSNYGVGISPFTGAAPIRFRMNLPPRRPNIHSNPVIPPLTEPPFPDPQLFGTDPSPSNSPNDDEEVDIYSDIEPERTDNDGDEIGDKNFGTLEPPPEPPALLMGLGQDDIDEENDEGGLVIDDRPYPPSQLPPPPPPPPTDAYDPAEPCDDSNSSGDFQDEKKHPNYGMHPTVGPIPEILSSKSFNSDGEEGGDENEDDTECPNFSMYSAASMNLARKNDEMKVKKSILVNYDDDDDDSSLPSVESKEDIRIECVPLPPEDKVHHSKEDDDNKIEHDNVSVKSEAENEIVSNDLFDEKFSKESDTVTMKDDHESTSDIPIPEDLKEADIPIPADINNEDIPIPEKVDKDNETGFVLKSDIDVAESKSHTDEENDDDDDDDDDQDDEDDDDDDQDDDEDNDSENNDHDHNESESADKKIILNKMEQIKIKTVVGKTAAVKDAEGEDECSTQDVLDLAIGSEGNLQDNLNNDENEEPSISIHMENPEELEEGVEKVPDAGEKPDGLVDITDEEMSVYDGQDNCDNLEKLSDDNDKEHGMNDSQKDIDMFDSDDNSLVGGATSAVSAGTLNNSDNQQAPTLPGLEGLETETISESEDVNFDELPESNQNEDRSIPNEEEYSSSKRKKKKKTRKTASVSEPEDASGKGQLDMVEFEEGEIIEDKPKQSSKKEKKSKTKHDKEVTEKDDVIGAAVAVAAPVASTTQINKEPVASDKKQKKKKDKKDSLKDKSVVTGASKAKEPKLKEKTVKAGEVDENIAWKKPSKSTKERNYRDGKEKEKDDKKQEPAKKEKKNKEKRKELERYDVRRLISEKPKRPKKDEFGRDLSPSKSHSLTPPRYRNRSPLRVRNRSRSRSWRSRSRSRGRIRRSRSRGRFRTRSRDRGRSRSREKARRSRSRRRTRSKERRRSKSKEKAIIKTKKRNRTVSRTRRRTKSRTPQRTNRRHSRSYSQSWSPSWSRSSVSRSPSPHTGRTRSLSRSLSRSWSRGREGHGSLLDVNHKNARKNLTVIVPNKEAVRKKDKKKTNKKKDEKRKRRRGQSPAPSKEVFTSGDNILVSVNFKSNRGAAEIVPATTPVLRESSKRKRDDIDPVTGKRKKDKSSKENVPLRNKSGQKIIVNKSNRLNRLNETTKNAKPVAVIDLDLSPFREQTPSPKEVIILSDSGEENDKQQKDMEKQLERLGEGLGSGRLSMDTDHQQNNSVSQPESPSTHSFMMTSTGPKTPPEPHVKFSIVSNKPQLRVLTNPLMECDEELRRDEATETEMEEVMHKGPNTPPEPPPDLNTPASPPTTPYDPFDPTKSRSPSPQPPSDSGMQVNSSREEKSAESSSNLQADTDEAHGNRIIEHRTLTPPIDSDELKKTPEPLKVLPTPKTDQVNTEISPKHQSPGTVGVEPSKVDDSLLKPFQKLLSAAAKVEPVHKSPDKLLNVVNISQQQMKNLNQTPTKQIGVIKKAGNLIPVYTPAMTINSNKVVRAQQNGGTGDPSDDILDLDAGSPYSPGSSEGDDLFDPPPMTPPRSSSKTLPTSSAKGPAKGLPLSTQNKFDLLFSASPMKLAARHGKHHGSGKASKKGAGKGKGKGGTGKKEVGVKLDEDQLKILDDLPSSAVEMQVKDKFLKKLNRQERVVEEVKLVLKPHYAKKHISKEDYKEILRRAVPKICHNKSGEINPIKIQFLIEAYVRKFRKLTAAKKKPAAAPNNQNAPPAKPKLQKTMWS